MPSNTNLSRSARRVADRLAANLARTQPATAASQAACGSPAPRVPTTTQYAAAAEPGLPGQLAGHAVAQADEDRGPLLALERVGLTLDGAAPPVQHRLAGAGPCAMALSRPLSNKAAAAPNSSSKNSASPSAIRKSTWSRESRLVTRTVPRETRAAAEISGVGALPVALEIRAREHHRGGIGRGGELSRRLGRVNRLIELLLVVCGSGLRQFRALSGRGPAEQDRQDGRQDEQSGHSRQEIAQIPDKIAP